MLTLEECKKREKEFREATAKFITKRTKDFQDVIDKTKPNAKGVRSPKGKKMELERMEHWWADAIWCGDETLTTLDEFFELSLNDANGLLAYIDAQGEHNSVVDWANEIFNEEFERLLPELKHVLEG